MARDHSGPEDNRVRPAGSRPRVRLAGFPIGVGGPTTGPRGQVDTQPKGGWGDKTPPQGGKTRTGGATP